MRRTRQPISAIDVWLECHDVRLDGVQIENTRWGSGIITRKTVEAEDFPMIQVPAELVLSEKYVWAQSETDGHLKECLEALTNFCRTARGAIMIFLLLQVSATSPDLTTRVGVETPWTTYVQYLPDEESLPTFWSETEHRYLQGTTLEPALEAKLRSLQREFEMVTSCLGHITWCFEAWFKNRVLTLQDWKILDAMYRSRAMEIPSHGSCMVPIIDMANHGHRTKVNARSDVDTASGDVNLVLDQYAPTRERPFIDQGDEVLISYGEDKGACEMLFSYGFLDDNMYRAECLFLDMADDNEDPLFEFKKQALPCAPGVKISHMMQSDGVRWNGAFVWLHCITYDDGLRIKGEHHPDGDRFKAFWRERELKSVVDLDDALQSDEMYDLFRLRACTLVRERAVAELQRREEIQLSPSNQDWRKRAEEEPTTWRNSRRLYQLEKGLLQAADLHLMHEISNLYETRAVKQYWNGAEDPEDYWGHLDQETSARR